MRHLLSVESLSKDEILHLVNLAAELKRRKKEGCEVRYLEGRNIALIFEKDSTRTRCAFEVAALDQGAHATYLGAVGSQIGKKESVKDSARVLGRMFDAIEYRGYGQHIVQTLADYSGVPVWNGLTDQSHPTQFLADLLTIREHTSKPLSDIKICFLGDAKNNVAMSLMVGAAKMGMHYAAAAPASYHPGAQTVLFLSEKYGADILLTSSLEEAVSGADFIYTDVWVSMGEPEDIWEKRIKDLSPYRVTDRVLEMTGNPDCRFMHCLPAFHNLETVVGKQICEKFSLSEMEVTDSVFEGPRSIVFDEAENRMHTIKATMVWSLAGNLTDNIGAR